MKRPSSGLIAVTRIAVVLVSFALTASAATPTVDLARYRGRVVLVDFWASWCAPCRQSFPWLNEMQAKYGARGLTVIGVNVDRERSDADRFLKENPAKFEIVHDPDGALAASYELPGMPSTYVYGPDGELVGRHIGFRMSARDEREAELQQLLSTISVKASPP